jgi:CBS domain containing-hemolysin-like protein
MPADGDRSPAAPPDGALHPGLWQRLTAPLRRRPPSIRDDLARALGADAAPTRDFSPEERAMLKNILGLRGQQVADVMVPRADITAVGLDVPLGEALRLFRAAEHSRLPVYQGTLDDPRGMIHIKDLLAHLTARAGSDQAGAFDASRIDFAAPLGAIGVVRPVLYVPPSMPAMDLLGKMQATRLHLALVIDEYGGTDGLVTIEDLLEMVVGDIEDEHDEENGPQLVPAADNAFVADARVSLEDAAAAIGPGLVLPEHGEDVETLGGLLVLLAGRVPVRGEIVPGPGDLEFEVLDADPRRVKRVKVQRRPPQAAAARAAAARRRRRDNGEVAPAPAAADNAAGAADSPPAAEPAAVPTPESRSSEH